MKITYGLLYLERIVIKGSAHYAHLKQSMTCELPHSEADHEEHLLGFDQNGSCTREVYYRIPDRTSKEDFELFLQSYPDARIIRIIDHEAILSSRQRERVNSGVIGLVEIARAQIIIDSNKNAVVDLFGLPVFGQNRLSLSGTISDQDYRWILNETGAELEDARTEQRLSNSQLTTERRITV